MNNLNLFLFIDNLKYIKIYFRYNDKKFVYWKKIGG